MASPLIHELNFRKSFLVTLPLLSVALQILGVVVAYIIGVEIGNIEPFPFVPYISKVGDKQPNASVFTLFVVLSCFTTGYVIWIQYRFLATENKCIRVNRVALCFGVMFVVSKIILSSFQMTTSNVIHLAGAGLYFLAVSIYMVLRTYIMFKVYGSTISMKCRKLNKLNIVFITRCICCACMPLTLACFAPFALIPQLSVFNRGQQNVAQGLEYFMVILKLIFTMTLVHEFLSIVRVRSKIEFIKEGVDDISLDRGTREAANRNSQLNSGVNTNNQDRVYSVVWNRNRVDDGLDGIRIDSYGAIDNRKNRQNPTYYHSYSTYN